jgi:hypothetical protein
MPKNPPFPFTAFPSFLLASICLSLCLPARAQTFDIRAQTGDHIKAVVYLADVGYTTSKQVYQGSFGAPSVNDKGNVAYACILAGKGITAFRSNSVVSRLKGKKPAVVCVQSGYPNIVSDGFGYPPINTFLYPGSVYFYRIGRDVAINKKNRIAFTAQSLYTIYTVNDKGVRHYTDTDTATYGVLSPTSKKAKHFNPIPVSTYINFFDGILTKTVSLNAQSSIAYNANFFITTTKAVEGFAFSSPTDGGVIATIESNVIGLPYFATFQSFTDAIIADNNIGFVTAQISDGNEDFDGIWQGNNPDLQPVAVKTDNAPGGGTFTAFGDKAGPSRNGKYCAFIASTSAGATGVYRCDLDGSNKIKIAAVGDAAPENGASGKLGTFNSFTLAASSDGGQVALLGGVNGSDGIWLSDAKGNNLKLVVIEGQTLKVGSVEKTIKKITFNPVSGINRSGQIAFTASFTDRTSAVIIAKL